MYRPIFARAACAAVLLVTAAVAAGSHPAAHFASQYTNEIAYDQSEIAYYQSELAQVQAQQSSVTAQKNTVLASALATQQQINVLQGQVSQTQVKFNQINAEYATTVSKVLEKESELETTQANLGKMVSYLYKYSQGDPMVQSLVNNGDVMKFFDTESNLQSINLKIRAMADQIAQEKAQLASLAAQEKAQADQVQQLLAQLQSQESLLNAQEALYQQQAAQLNAQDQSITGQAQALVGKINYYRNDMANAEIAQAEYLAQLAAEQAAQSGGSQYGNGVISGGSGGNWPDHFPWGQCTWYVATQRYVPWWGNANEWVAGAESYGYAVGMTPEVGSIVVWGGGDGYDIGYGHVAYVVAVQSASSFTVHEANYYGLGIVDQRQVYTLAGVIGFIYGQN